VQTPVSTAMFHKEKLVVSLTNIPSSFLEQVFSHSDFLPTGEDLALFLFLHRSKVAALHPSWNCLYSHPMVDASNVVNTMEVTKFNSNDVHNDNKSRTLWFSSGNYVLSL